MALAQSTSMECFLQTLLGDGRISTSEYTTAMTLTRKDEEQSRKTRIPGAVTVEYAALPSSHLAAISAVFNTVELVEQIFSWLDPKDLIMTVSPTCRGFQSIVNTTPALRRKLYLQEDKTGNRIHTPAIKNIHYTVTNRWIQILIVNAGEMLNKYSLVRNMLLTQPAPKTAQIFYDCACRSRDAGYVVKKEGLRFGDVQLQLNESFKSSQASQNTSKACACKTYKEARIVVKYQ